MQTAMGWKNNFTFRNKRYIEADVEGKTMRFYPNRMALLTEASELSAPLAQAIATLMGRSKDNEQSSTVVTQEEGDFTKTDITTDAASLEIIKHHEATQTKAITDMFGTFGCPKSQALLGKLFMDSLRDEFPYHANRPPQDVEEFVFGDGEDYHGLDAPTVVALFKGWMQANAKVFGKVGEQMVEVLKSKAAALASEHLSETERETSTNGNDLPTPSSTQ